MVTRETSIRSGLAQLGLLEDLDDADAVVARLERYVEILRDEALPRGYLGPEESDRLITRHVLESAALFPIARSDGPAKPDGPLVDVGSGAGLPGLVLAVLGAQPVVLVESQARRANFLRSCVARLGFHVEHLRIVTSTAEEAGRSDLRELATVALCRALAPPAVALELLLPLTRPGGLVLLVGGHDAPADVSTELGGGLPEPIRFEVPGLKEPRWVTMVQKIHATPERYPRRPGVPRRRPLGGDVV